MKELLSNVGRINPQLKNQLAYTRSILLNVFQAGFLPWFQHVALDTANVRADTDSVHLQCTSS